MQKMFLFLATVVGFVAGFLSLRKERQQKEKFVKAVENEKTKVADLHIEAKDPLRDSTDKAQDRTFGGGRRDIVDEASWQSFPASDPPAYH